eukprot:GABV01009675.1.p2 GENE.GABV01009675.1~~GABV01009675.1.p2  ORF type:complete len:110 (+),score=55.52 GABV01009675.1:191-520(+)
MVQLVQTTNELTKQEEENIQLRERIMALEQELLEVEEALAHAHELDDEDDDGLGTYENDGMFGHHDHDEEFDPDQIVDEEAFDDGYNHDAIVAQATEFNATATVQGVEE